MHFHIFIVCHILITNRGVFLLFLATDQHHCEVEEKRFPMSDFEKIYKVWHAFALSFPEYVLFKV